MRTPLLAAVTAAVVLGAANADADEPETWVGAEPQPSPTAPAATDDSALRLDVLERTLAYEQRRTSTVRTGLGIGALAVGVTMLPVGLISGRREHTAGAFTAAFIGMFGLVTAGRTLISWSTPWYEELSDVARSERAAGHHPAAILGRVETEWHAKAEKARKGRTVDAALGLSLGATAFAIGSVILLTKPPDDISRSEYRGLGGVITLLGGLESLAGVAAISIETPVEDSLHRYEATAPRRAALHVVPTLSGVVGTF